VSTALEYCTRDVSRRAHELALRCPNLTASMTPSLRLVVTLFLISLLTSSSKKPSTGYHHNSPPSYAPKKSDDFSFSPTKYLQHKSTLDLASLSPSVLDRAFDETMRLSNSQTSVSTTVIYDVGAGLCSLFPEAVSSWWERAKEDSTSLVYVAFESNFEELSQVSERKRINCRRVSTFKEAKHSLRSKTNGFKLYERAKE